MCEKVIPSSNCSWRFVKYQLPYIDFNWHYHPEYEICLTLNSEGLRYVGDSIEKYHHTDLVIIGPEMPHTWHSQRNDDGSEQVVYVAQIPKHWLDNLLLQHSEFASLKTMLTQSVQGIQYSQNSALGAIALMQACEQATPFTRFSLLMQLLDIMRQDKNAQLLSSHYFLSDNKSSAEVDKLDKVIKYIYQNYTEQLYADKLAELAHMSTNHFHRFFKKRTERTLTEFINQLRIGQACKLLINTNSPIALISDQCGFNNVSNFNRRFLLLKGVTPSQFRKNIKAPSLVD